MTKDEILLFLINWHKYSTITPDNDNWILTERIAELFISLGEKYQCLDEMYRIGI